MTDAQGMSNAFSAGLADSFNDALGANGGGMATAFVGVVKYIDADGDACWSFISMTDQPLDMSLGMLNIATKIVENQVAGQWGLSR